MRVNDLLETTIKHHELSLLVEQCTDFLNESDGMPLYKSLPSTYADFHKVKVRKRKTKEDNGDFVEIFNEAFEEEARNLRERAVFAYGNVNNVFLKENEEPFYIFPIDGFKYMYSKEVENSSDDYQSVLDAIFEQMGSDKGSTIVADLLKFTYNTTNLNEGLEQGSEIILYNIPYFFAVRTSHTTDYEDLLTSLTELV